jgi:L-2-amino-thiazoline-4-carboxylic acid hydrolase
MSENYINYSEKGIQLDQDAYYQQFDAAFLAVLRTELPEAGILEDQQILQHRDEVIEASQHLIVDQASRLNMRFGAMVIACHQLLCNLVPAEHLRLALHRALNEPNRQEIFDGTRAMLDHAPDPFAAIVETSKARETGFFGPSFEFERLQDDAHAYLVNVKRCLWYSLFADHQLLDLMPMVCAFDLSYMDAVQPQTDGFRIERPTTLGWGHDACRFWMIRTERTSLLNSLPDSKE